MNNRLLLKLKGRGCRGVLSAIYHRLLRWPARWIRISADDLDRSPLLGRVFPNSGMNKLHTVSMDFRKAHRHSLTNTRGWLILSLIWPLLSLVMSLQTLLKNGPQAERLAGIGYLHQLFHLGFVTIIGGLHPKYYYQYRMFRDGRWKKARSYITDRQGYFLSGGINNLLAEITQLDDKDVFFSECQSRDLPTIAPMAKFEGGKLESPVKTVEFPSADLFVKPVYGGGGQGMSLWTYSMDTDSWENESNTVTRSRLRDHFQKMSLPNNRLLVQRRAINSQSLSSFSLKGLCTFRVVTYRMPDADPEVAFIGLKMPTGDSPLDNMTAGGIVAQVDLVSGMLSPAVPKHLDQEFYMHHPTTNAKIAEVVVAELHEIMKLALKAHLAFYRFAIIGWDIAVTPDGLLLVEGNIGASADIIQPANNTPLGMTAYKDCCLAWLGNLHL